MSRKIVLLLRKFHSLKHIRVIFTSAERGIISEDHFERDGLEITGVVEILLKSLPVSAELIWGPSTKQKDVMLAYGRFLKFWYTNVDQPEGIPKIAERFAVLRRRALAATYSK